MLPLPLAYEVQREIFDFLNVSFEIKANKAGSALKKFYTETYPLVKGPFVKVSLPYRVSGKEDVNPLVVKPSYPPYIHQLNSFRRLYFKASQNTIVTTGTGSGKTECFLFPVLDYVNFCHDNEMSSGIKAIVLYPMNALLEDQAVRFAKELKNAGLTHLRVGKYTGGSGLNRSMNFKDFEVISNRDELTRNPPDILLTNYKMLDYLLFRDQEKNLWNEDTKKSLKYLILDEMHTFDGAQGSDVACLIRRLKAVVGRENLTFVGTSATLSSSADAKKRLCDFATNLFGSEFDDNCIVMEDKYEAKEYLDEGSKSLDDIPSVFDTDPESLLYNYGESLNDYVTRLLAAFGAQDLSKHPEKIAELLKSYDYFGKLIDVSSKEVVEINQLHIKMSELYPRYEKMLGDKGHRILILTFLTLASVARSSGSRPFLTIKSSLWVKELKKVLAKVVPFHEEWEFITDDASLDLKDLYLPAYYCAQCGEAGWGIQGDGKLSSTIAISRGHNQTRSQLFSGQGFVAFPLEKPLEDSEECFYLDRDAHCFTQFDPQESVDPDDETFFCIVPQKDGRCPSCDTKIDMRSFSLGTSSLTSVLSTACFSHPLNLDRKLIAFSDSIQDASYQASFVNNRTYNFAFRRYLSHYLKEGITLSELSNSIVDLKKLPRDNALRLDLLGRFAPDRLKKKWELDGMTGPIVTEAIMESLAHYIHYSVLSELSFSSRLGWSMEKVGFAGLFLKREILNKILKADRSFLEQTGLNFSDKDFEIFLIAFFEKLKHNGVIYDEKLETYYQDEKASFYKVIKQYPDLPLTGKGSRPRFFSPKTHEDKTKREYLSVGGKTSWFARYLGKLGINERIQSFYQDLSSWLVRLDIFVELDGLKKRYVLDDDLFAVSLNLEVLECDHCKTRLTLSQELSQVMEGSPCQQRFCEGKIYRVDQRSISSYFERYFSEDQVRINASEHTGSLKSDVRDKVEKEFKATSTNTPNLDVNFLSCTPTMEMGIDIGDLSSVILKNAPRSAASYFQRIGRSGRTTGNSLDFLVMDQRAHNQYFWSDPSLLLNWQVVTPACRYQTAHILIRQYHAYVMDQYLHSNHEAYKILPTSFSFLVESDSMDASYWDGLWVFEEENRDYLFKKFTHLFNLRENVVFEEMRSYVKAGSMKEQFEKLFSQMRATINSTLMDAGFIDKEIKDLSGIENFTIKLDLYFQDTQGLKLEEAFPEIDIELLSQIAELYEEKSSLLRKYEALTSSRQNYFLGFVASKGLLPGYAFPEEGCTLDFTIRRSRKVKGKAFYEIEVDRAPALALRDLAPYNTFYTHGMKAMPNRFDFFRKKDPTKTLGICFTCGNVSQKNSCSVCQKDVALDEYVEFKKIKASSDFKNSYVLDASESRDRENYEMETKFQFNELKANTRRIGFYNSEKLFGYEFQTNVDIYSFNNGHRLPFNPVTKVFKACKSCGMIDSPYRAKEVVFTHLKNCPDKEQELTEIKLFRKITSDCVRIPLGDGLLSPLLQTIFTKAIQVYLKGDTGHLELTTLNSEEDAQGYLVIYDNVPGGTGHLRDLFGIRLEDEGVESPEHLLNVLKEALDEIKLCPCDNGCFRCVWNIDNVKDKDVITKRVVAYYLNLLVSQKVSEFKKINDSIVQSKDNLSFDGHTEAYLFQCLELMSRFTRKEDKSFKIETIKIDADESRWRIKFQHGSCILVSNPTRKIEIGDIYTKPDFSIENEEGENLCYLYADGAKFHLSPGMKTPVFVNDVKLRTGLSGEKNVPVLTFTYGDIVEMVRMISSELTYRDGVLHDQEVIHFASSVDDMSLLKVKFLYRVLSQAATGEVPNFERNEYKELMTLLNRIAGDAISWQQQDKNIIVKLMTDPDLRFSETYQKGIFEVNKSYLKDWQKFWLLYNLIQMSPDYKKGFIFTAA